MTDIVSRRAQTSQLVLLRAVEPRLTATPLARPPRYHGHLVITATSLSRPPRHHGHFIVVGTKAQSGLFLYKEPP